MRSRTPLLHRGATLTAALLLALPLAACSDNDDEALAPRASEPEVESSAEASPDSDDLSGKLIVFAASSLTDAYQELGDAFEADHPDVDVEFSFGSSSTLAAQVNESAPADVLATASPTTMETVTEAGSNAEEPEFYVSNTLQIVVEAGNPEGIEGLEDFTDEGLTLVACASQVPCGAAADKVFGAADVEPSLDSREQNVRDTLTKVELGEADAGLVYQTDVAIAGDEVEGVDFPAAEEAVNDYPIVLLEQSENVEAARAWISFILSDEAAEVFEDYGFVTL